MLHDQLITDIVLICNLLQIYQVYKSIKCWVCRDVMWSEFQSSKLTSLSADSSTFFLKLPSNLEKSICQSFSSGKMDIFYWYSGIATGPFLSSGWVGPLLIAGCRWSVNSEGKQTEVWRSLSVILELAVELWCVQSSKLTSLSAL